MEPVTECTSTPQEATPKQASEATDTQKEPTPKQGGDVTETQMWTACWSRCQEEDPQEPMPTGTCLSDIYFYYFKNTFLSVEVKPFTQN